MKITRMPHIVIQFVLLYISLCLGHKVPVNNELTGRIGNFSIEILFHTAQMQPEDTNLVVSPITVWTVLAATSECAGGNTLKEINNAIRLTTKREKIRKDFKDINRWLEVKTNAIQLSNINAMFVDVDTSPMKDFIELADDNYYTKVVPLKFMESESSAAAVNKVVSNLTHGRISKLVDSTYFAKSSMILTSAVFFKAQWTLPFDASMTERKPFFNRDGTKIGEVNMMYSKHTYPYAYIPELQASVIELPYGFENRLSMVIMLPNSGISLENMFKQFGMYNLDKMFAELRKAKEEFSDDEVQCFIPRFRSKSDIDLTSILKERFGVSRLFDPSKARLPHIARRPIYVSRMVHKAEIEVTEESTTAAGVTDPEPDFVRTRSIRFVANRPFSYMIIEKVTNTIVFGGLYQEPSLF